MCFSAAVIIILGTQAQTNPLNRTPREREWERQNTPPTAHMSVFQQQCHLKEREKRGTAWKNVERENKKINSSKYHFPPQMFVYWINLFNHRCTCRADKAGKKGYSLVKHVFANITWRMDEPWNPTVPTETIPGTVSQVLDNASDICSIFKEPLCRCTDCVKMEPLSH